MKYFLSSELWHSLKRKVKLLWRKLRGNFHHNLTTLLLEDIWVFLWVCYFSFSIRMISTLPKGIFPIRVTMHQKFWKLCPCKLLTIGVKHITFTVKRLWASYICSLTYSSLFSNQRLSWNKEISFSTNWVEL